MNAVREQFCYAAEAMRRFGDVYRDLARLAAQDRALRQLDAVLAEMKARRGA